MAETVNTNILNRCKTASGVTMVVGECIDTTDSPFSGTMVAVNPSLKFVHAALATYKEDPGDVRPPFVASSSGDQVVFTVATDMPIGFVIFGCD